MKREAKRDNLAVIGPILFVLALCAAVFLSTPEPNPPGAPQRAGHAAH